MTIYQRMASIFEAASIPGFLQEWMATDEYPVIPDKYCTYLVEQDAEALAADDGELVHVTRVWVDLYGVTDVTDDLRRLKQALYAGGFLLPFTRDLDNHRLSGHQYHRRMRVDYYDYNPEEE